MDGTDNTGVDHGFGGRFEDFKPIEGIENTRANNYDSVIVEQRGWGFEGQEIARS